MQSRLWQWVGQPAVLIGVSVILSSSITSSPGQGCYLIEPGGLIGWWKGEGNGTDSAGAHPATLVNGVGFSPAEVGLGFSLSGGNDYVALSPNVFFNYPSSGSGNGPFSFEVWFSTTSGGVILGQQNTQPFTIPSAYVPAIYVGTDGRLYVSMFWDLFSRFISPGTVNDGAFHHVAVTYDGTTETVYLDGRVIGSEAFTQLGYASTYYYQLGTGYTAGLWPAANGGWFSFRGIIDEASLYNRALAPAEVLGIYLAGSAGKCPSFPGLPPQIVSQPASQTVPPGGTATFNVTASNATGYQWQFNGQTITGSSHYVGATSNVLTVVGAGPSDVGSYRVIAFNLFGSTTSSVAGLTLQSAACVPAPSGLIAWYKAEGNPSDSADAENASTANAVSYAQGEVGLGFALPGGNAFVVLPPNLFPYPTTGNSGHAPFSFETWFSTTSGGVILGQQEADQSGFPFGSPNGYVPAVYVGNDGRLYVSMFWAGVTPIVSPGTVNNGAFHHVAVTYNGIAEVAYLDGVVIGSHAMTQLGYADSYYYQLGIGFTAGWPSGNGAWFSFIGIIDEASVYNRALSASEVQSIVAADGAGKCPPTANAAPQIVTQPANQTVPQGANATFTVTATGTPPLSYQWQMHGVNLGDSSDYAGTHTSTLTVLGVNPPDAGAYGVVVSNAFGSITSAIATLTVTVPTCGPAPPGLVAWYKGEGNAVDSADSHDGTILGPVLFGQGEVVTGFAWNQPGVNACVQLPPNLFPYPISGNTGNAPFSFETWFSTQNGGVILGQQNTLPFTKPSAYVPAIYVGTDGRLYVAMFWDQFARIISPGTVNDRRFHHVAVTYDSTTEVAYLDGTVIGSRPFTQIGYASTYYYQLGSGYTAGLWPAANGDWFTFEGVIDEASIYNRSLSASEVQTIYGAGAAGKCPPVTSGAPQIVAQPAAQTVAVGANATFTVIATGTAPLSFQWQLNGLNLANSTHVSGATSNALTVVGVGPGDIGSYRVIVSNAFGSTLSATATLSLQQPGCVPAPSGLIAWYRAEGNALDSADSHNGTLVNAAGFQPGEAGQGFFMPGGTAYVQLPPNLFPYPTTGQSGHAPFSFETWFNTPITGGVILGQQEADQSGTPFNTPHAFVPAIYVGDDGRLYVMMFWDVFRQIVSPGLVNDNTFHHVAVTYDGTTEVVYLDGGVIGSRPMTQIGYADNYLYQLGTGFTSGWPFTTGGWFPFVGVIDEAAVYNRALSASEIGALFSAGNAGKCP